MKRLFSIVAIVGFGLAWPAVGEVPNIVVIISDDQGYADVSYNPESPPEVSTPHIDALAAESVICTNGYASGHVCSPTRAGLMTGRYQQRFGVYTAGQGGSGMPLDEVWIPTYLKDAGYVSGALGKWHLGLTMDYHAMNRGFDEFYGFMGRGAHPYFDHSDMEHPVYRGLEPIANEEGYMTTLITEEAVDFVERHKDEPFFLYVAYNAVHTPAEAPAEDIKPVTDDETRNILMGMLKHLDMGVGEIVGKLKEEGLFENTLIFYLSDNGGASAMSANNAPLRGFKQHDYEGGIRVPFIVSWPAQLEGGTTCDVPLWSTDILPTILAATGGEALEEKPLDGRDMLPALKGEVDALHENLFWSSGGDDGQWGMRSGKWKLVGIKDQLELFDLDADIGETTNLADAHPEVVSEMRRDFDAWIEEMAPPIGGGAKVWSPRAESAKKRKDAEKAEKKARRKAENDAEREKRRTQERAKAEAEGA
ncbi:MAG: sulfatase-like hydrolase/transferase [Verrucomicrobiota bacterium]